MGELVAFAVLVLAGAAFSWWIGDDERTRRDRFRESLEQASRELGIKFRPSPPFSFRAFGDLDDVAVQIRVGSTERVDPLDEHSERRARLQITATGPLLPREVSFGPETGGGNDVLTGDTVFDDIVEVYGPPSVVLALLGKDARQKVAVFVQSGGQLLNGTLTLSQLSVSEWDIPAALRMVVSLARLFATSPGGGICDRLAQNARDDPHPSVRLWNLLQVQEEFQQTPRAKEVSREALSDPAPWIRLSAARFLIGEGDEVLEALARNRDVPEQAAAEAVGLLAARLPVDRAGQLLLDALRTHRGDACRAAAEQLGRLRYAPAVQPLARLLKGTDFAAATIAAAALGRLGDPTAERALAEALHGEAHELRFAAAEALGRVGTVRSVEPLTALLAGRLDSATRRAINDAIAHIQSRLVGAEAGQLTLAAERPESGRLSLATPQSGPGDLSLASAPERRSKG